MKTNLLDSGKENGKTTVNSSSRRAFLQQCGSGLAAVSFAASARSNRARAEKSEILTPEQRQEWYWDSVASIHFDNGGRTLARGMSPELLTRELRAIPIDMIQVAAYGGDGMHTGFPSQTSPKGFAPQDPWDSLSIWSDVARETGKRFHIYAHTFNGVTPEGLADANPHYRGGQFSAGYQRFMEEVNLPILREALDRYGPRGVWVDGSERLVHDPVGYRQQIAEIVHQHNSAAMMTFNHSWMNLACGDPDPSTPPSYVDTVSFDRVPTGGGLDHSRAQGMFYSSLAAVPHDMMHCLDRRGQTYEDSLPGGGLAMASGGSWFLWVDNNGSGEGFLESLARARKAAEWANLRKPALGRTRSANQTAVLVSETQWREGGTTYGALGPAGLAWDDDVPLLQACAMSLQDQGFLVDIVNEETLVQYGNLYQRVFVPGNPRLSEAAEDTLRGLQSQGITVERNVPAQPAGHAPDIQAAHNTTGCVFSLRQQVPSNRYVLHVVDLRDLKRSEVSFRLPLASNPSEIEAYPRSVHVDHKWSDGGSTITLRELEVHAAIVLDCSA